MPATHTTASEIHADMLYLASQSARRRQLLDQIGVHHELLLPGADEDAEALEAVLPGEAPEAYCQRVTLAKLAAARARHVARGLADGPILAADTTVALDESIFGKPADDEDAARMLQQLAGRTHRVITAVAVIEAPHPAFLPQLALQVSSVRMRVLEVDEIVRYVASGESQGKAGAYAIQSQAAAWIEHIEGSHSGIMGLPLFETAQLLRGIGLRF
ncbi:Maf family protein [Rivibacter subsaxonicus]|uniref:dTTP/UTP pyrophosphatase n=1 Tax=Rivibacter subsaxonicus TaxID=457575 RepID=A0A4Q7W224_9BURK|nr:nucleoside triphosphate pyrophosphatase [Rivibacter subsaxonicus]RZU03028.1 septum formation protein [Rivibacter subsaxonicus]